MADTAKMSDEQVGKLTALFDVFDPDGHAPPASGMSPATTVSCMSGGAGAQVANGLDARQGPAGPKFIAEMTEWSSGIAMKGQ